MNTVKSTRDKKSQTLGMAQVALFAALIFILAFTPFIGYIPLGFTRATIIHIPVIIGCLMLGPKKGAILGFCFGLTSLLNNTFNPTATSFVFSPFYELGEIHGGIGSVIICFVPRILVGVIPYYVYQGIHRFTKKNTASETVALAVAGLSGSLTNTLLVMHLIFLFYKDAYATATNRTSALVYRFILSVIAMNGIPEAIVAAILVALACRILLKTKHALR